MKPRVDWYNLLKANRSDADAVEMLRMLKNEEPDEQQSISRACLIAGLCGRNDLDLSTPLRDFPGLVHWLEALRDLG
jgi:hypothetical protein